MSKLIVLNPFLLPDLHSDSHGIFFDDESLCVQADVQAADINNIVKSFGITSQLPYGNDVPSYIDYTDAPNDFHASMNFIRDSNELFMEYPADVRARFSNDAGAFLDFVADDANRDEAINLGFAIKRDLPPDVIDNSKSSKESMIPDDLSKPPAKA